MRTYDEAYADALDQRPFSNGTEGYAWTGTWCDTCIHDATARNDTGPGCPLLLVALMGRTPKEWFDQWEKGQPPPALGDTYHCVEYRSEDDGPGGEPQPVPDLPGQLTLLPRDGYEGVRMFVDVARSARPEQVTR